MNSRPTPRDNDPLRIYARLASGNDVSRNILLRLCGGSKHRLAAAIARLRNDGKDVQNVKAGPAVWYRLAKEEG